MNYSIDKETLIKVIVSMISSDIENYSVHEKSGQYALNTKEGKCLLNYLPNSKELYCDHSLFEYISKFVPIGYDIDTFQGAVKKYFKSQFPKMMVKQVHGANIVSY